MVLLDRGEQAPRARDALAQRGGGGAVGSHLGAAAASRLASHAASGTTMRPLSGGSAASSAERKRQRSSSTRPPGVETSIRITRSGMGGLLVLSVDALLERGDAQAAHGVDESLLGRP